MNSALSPDVLTGRQGVSVSVYRASKKMTEERNFEKTNSWCPFKGGVPLTGSREATEEQLGPILGFSFRE